MKSLKKSLIALFLLVTLPLSLFAYNEDVSLLSGKNEVYVGYGYPKTLSVGLIGGFTNFFSILFTGGLSTMKTTGPGVTQLGYNRFITDNVAVGGLFTFEPYTVTNTSGETVSVSKQGNFTTQVNVKFQYGWDHIKLYHRVSAGLGLMFDFTNDTTTPTFTMDIVPIGIKAEIYRGINLYADVALWSTSLINLGANYTF